MWLERREINFLHRVSGLQFFHIDAPVSAEQAFLNQLDIATQLLRESSVSDVDTTEAEQRRLSWGCLNGVNFNLPICTFIIIAKIFAFKISFLS